MLFILFISTAIKPINRGTNSTSDNSGIVGVGEVVGEVFAVEDGLVVDVGAALDVGLDEDVGDVDGEVEGVGVAPFCAEVKIFPPSPTNHAWGAIVKLP